MLCIIAISLHTCESTLRALEIGLVASQAAGKHPCSPLKDELRKCIQEFLRGRDVFIVLPIGYEKTVAICLECLLA